MDKKDISDEEIRELFGDGNPAPADTLPYDDELEYLYRRLRRTENSVIALGLTFAVYIVIRMVTARESDG